MRRFAQDWLIKIYRPVQKRASMVAVDLIIQSINQWILDQSEQVSGSLQPPISELWKHRWMMELGHAVCLIEPFRFGPARTEWLGNSIVASGSVSEVTAIIPDQFGYGVEPITIQIDQVQVSLDLITFPTRTKTDLLRCIIQHASTSGSPSDPSIPTIWDRIASFLAWTPKLSFVIRSISISIPTMEGLRWEMDDVRLILEDDAPISITIAKINLIIPGSGSIAFATKIALDLDGLGQTICEIGYAMISDRILLLRSIPGFDLQQTGATDSKSATIWITCGILDFGSWRIDRLEICTAVSGWQIYFRQIYDHQQTRPTTISPREPNEPVVTISEHRIAFSQSIQISASLSAIWQIHQAIPWLRFLAKIGEQIVTGLPTRTKAPWEILSLSIVARIEDATYAIQAKQIQYSSISRTFFGPEGSSRIRVAQISVRGPAWIFLAGKLDLVCQDLITRGTLSSCSLTGSMRSLRSESGLSFQICSSRAETIEQRFPILQIQIEHLSLGLGSWRWIGTELYRRWIGKSSSNNPDLVRKLLARWFPFPECFGYQIRVDRLDLQIAKIVSLITELELAGVHHG